jgi:hypothetical protein
LEPRIYRRVDEYREASAVNNVVTENKDLHRWSYLESES